MNKTPDFKEDDLMASSGSIHGAHRGIGVHLDMSILARSSGAIYGAHQETTATTPAAEGSDIEEKMPLLPAEASVDDSPKGLEPQFNAADLAASSGSIHGAHRGIGTRLDMTMLARSSGAIYGAHHVDKGDHDED